MEHFNFVRTKALGLTQNEKCSKLFQSFILWDILKFDISYQYGTKHRFLNETEILVPDQLSSHLGPEPMFLKSKASVDFTGHWIQHWIQFIPK